MGFKLIYRMELVSEISKLRNQAGGHFTLLLHKSCLTPHL